MKRRKPYGNARFEPETIREAASKFRTTIPEKWQSALDQMLKITIPGEGEWTHDNEEEFFEEYRQHRETCEELYYSLYVGPIYELSIQTLGSSTSVSVRADSRAQIATIFDIFERDLPSALLPEPPPPAVPPPITFIGHGRSDVWRDLKDHLQDQHGHRVVAYETGARAGHEIRDVLEELMQESSFAILVLTGEDATTEGLLRARQNVVHEMGLFQGRLGFSRVMILMEEGVEEFSNIEGIHQTRFSSGNIRETFGDVVATLRREFG